MKNIILSAFVVLFLGSCSQDKLIEDITQISTEPTNNYYIGGDLLFSVEEKESETYRYTLKGKVISVEPNNSGGLNIHCAKSQSYVCSL